MINHEKNFFFTKIILFLIKNNEGANEKCMKILYSKMQFGWAYYYQQTCTCTIVVGTRVSFVWPSVAWLLIRNLNDLKCSTDPNCVPCYTFYKQKAKIYSCSLNAVH